MAWEALAAEFEAATGRKPYPFELDLILRFRIGGTWAASVKSEWIRGYLLTFGEGYPYGMWREYRRFAEFLGIRPGTYTAFATHIWLLRRLGLVVPVRRSGGRGDIPRTYYRIAPGMEDHPAWRRPKQVLYPRSSDWTLPENREAFRRRYR